MDQIKEANDKNREFAEEPEDAKLLMSFKGTSASTAVTAVTGIDGTYRFETPESLIAFFGLAVPHKESAHKKTEAGLFTKKQNRGEVCSLGCVHKIQAASIGLRSISLCGMGLRFGQMAFRPSDCRWSLWD